MTADIDPEILRNRIPWIASQMRDSGMYTQASEIEAILPLLAELEQLRAERDRYRADAQQNKDYADCFRVDRHQEDRP